MLVLFDQSTPMQLRDVLAEHTVETAWERGWSTLQNGDLLHAAETAGFEVFVTADKNLKYQQNLRLLRIAIVVLPTNQWSKLTPWLHAIKAAVSTAGRGTYSEVGNG